VSSNLRQAGGAGHLSFMPPDRFPQQPFRPAGIRVGAIISSQVIDPHGEQDGTVDQEVTFAAALPREDQPDHKFRGVPT
jgi:hypothetical protein